MKPSPITTHVLDTAKGRPAQGIAIVLEYAQAERSATKAGEASSSVEHKRGVDFVLVGQGRTDDDGRLRTLLEPGTLQAGTYRLTFKLDAYFGDAEHFFPEASLVFKVQDLEAHYHVPLLLSPFGFSTYRGS